MKFIQNTIFIFSMLLWSLGQVIAQNQANIWYFGHYKGLDFNKDTVKVIEGPASFHSPINSVCNKVGDLRFYLTDRSELYDAAHKLVQEFKVKEGCQIAESSIIPHPKHPDVYYIFTVQTPNTVTYGQALQKEDDYFRSGWVFKTSDIRAVNPNSRKFYLYCSLVMIDKQDNVIFLQQEQELMDFEAKIVSCTTLRHGQASYSFLLLDTHKAELTIYTIDKGGFSKKSKKTINLEQYEDFKGYKSIGHIAVLGGSILGNKVLFVTKKRRGNVLIKKYHVMQFKPQSRSVEYVLNIPCPYSRTTTSAEFSPNGSKLYINTSTNNNTKSMHILYQYDLSAGKEAEILASEVKIESEIRAEFHETAVHDIQLAPNGKIYGVSLHEYMYVINHPNEKGEACGFEPRAIYLGKGANGGLYLPAMTHLLGK